MAPSIRDAEEILKSTDSINGEVFGNNHAARMQALEKARSLCSRLETPWDRLTRTIWLEPAISVSIKICLDLDIFSKLDADGSGKSSSDLAQATGAEAVLLSRLMRLLASSHVVNEVEADRYSATDFSIVLTEPGFIGGFCSQFSSVWPVFNKLPEYLAQNGYQSPHDAFNGPFQFAKQTELHRARWLQENPEEGHAFNALMAEYHKQPYPLWIDIYPPSHLTESLKASSDQNNHALIVDVGGGTGRAMENLRQSLLPNTYEIVVQDLPGVVSQGKQLHPFLQFKEIDFIKEQPVHGASAYFMQSVLHDWPDEKAKLILQNVSRAFQPGFGKLLLCENVMPEKDIYPTAGALDIVMMAFFCAKERTEGDWIRLLESANYRLVHIWRAKGTHRCVIEAAFGSIDP